MKLEATPKELAELIVELQKAAMKRPLSGAVVNGHSSKAATVEYGWRAPYGAKAKTAGSSSTCAGTSEDYA